MRGGCLFGSRARGEARADSDTDIMVELDPAAHVTLFDYVGLKDYIASLFDGPVDVVNREGLKPHVRPAVTADAVISEASRRLPGDMKARLPSITCKNMAGVGNIYRHDYEDVAATQVWETVQVALPQLRVVVRHELGSG